MLETRILSITPINSNNLSGDGIPMTEKVSPLDSEEKLLDMSVNCSVYTLLHRNAFDDKDFSTLIRFLSYEDIPESYPLDKGKCDKEWKMEALARDAEKMLPLFLEFLRRKYFSVNDSIPEDTMRVLGKVPPKKNGEYIVKSACERPCVLESEERNEELKRYKNEEWIRLKTNPIVQRGILDYVKAQNEEVMSSRCSDQYNALAFNLFLLWADIDFSLMKSVYSGKFDEIQALLAGSSSKIDIFVEWSKRIKEQYEGAWDTPENLIYQLQRHVQICETLNKLALIHAVNFEERQVSLSLGNLIRENIDKLLKNLESLVPDYPDLGNYSRQLDNIAGKVQRNFARGQRINGSSIEEIQEQGRGILQELQEGFERQKRARFGCALNEDFTEKEEEARMILKGESAVIHLIMSELISNLPDGKTQPVSQERSWPIQDLVEVYQYATGIDILTKDMLIRHFIDGGAENTRNDFPIEVVYNIVLFDDSIPENTLADLVRFFLAHSAEPKSSSYEEYTVKIIAQTIRRLRTCRDRGLFMPLANAVRTLLESQDVSRHVLNYSKLYLALALYYIESPEAEHIGHSKHCFAHYKSLTMHLGSDEKVRRYEKDEEWFYAALGYSMFPIDLSGMQLSALSNHQYYLLFLSSGNDAMIKDMEDRRSAAVSGIAKTSSDMIASMTGDGDINRISDSFWKDIEKRIAKTIFYNICTVEIRCGSYENISKKRECETQEILLNSDSSIIFTYPLSSEKKLFNQIFLQHKDLIRQDIGNLIAIYNRNMKDEWLATHNAETGLSNWNALKETLKNSNEKSDPYHIVCVRMEEQNHNTEAIRANIIDYVVAGISNIDPTILPYHTSFAFVFLLPAQHFANNKVTDFVNGFERIIKVGGPQSVHKAYIGYAIQQWDTPPMELYDQASLALEQSARCGWITTYTPSLQQESDTKEKNSKILREALTNQSEEWELVPFYQEIRINGASKYEALMRIHNKKTGRYFPPQPFLDAIEWSSSDQKEISFHMFDCIIQDMTTYPQLRVSFNMHTFDFGNEAVYSRLINLDSELCIRMTIEILESVNLGDELIVAKLHKLKWLWFSTAFDDFGVQRAWLDRYYQFSPEFAKIDQVHIIRLTKADDKLQKAYAALDEMLKDQPETLSDINSLLMRSQSWKWDSRKEVEENIESFVNTIQNKGLVRAIKRCWWWSHRLVGCHETLASAVRLIKSYDSVAIAEYVENWRVLSLLESIGVEWFQGYGIRKPAPIGDIFGES